MTEIVDINLGAKVGSVAPGDLVIAGGAYSVVTMVTIHPAELGPPPGAPIKAGYIVVEVETLAGATRWLGADTAEIGSDLRVHWSRA